MVPHQFSGQTALVEIRAATCSDGALEVEGWRKITANDKPPCALPVPSLRFPLV